MNDIYPDFSGIIRDYDALNNKPTLDGTPLQGEIKDKILNFLPKANGSAYAHDHDSRYYTETEVNSLLESLRVQFENYSLKSQFADYVTEQGISGNWSYRKWDSGVAECWGTVPITLQKNAYEIVTGTGIYCASGFGGSVLKNLFTSYDCVSIDPINWYQISGSGRVTSGGTLEGNVFGFGSNMSSLVKDGTVDVNCIVKGRWK